jgi:uncharacterized integral membrane protein
MAEEEHHGGGQPPAVRMRRSPAARAATENLGALIIAAIIVVGTLVFWVQNREKVTISYLSVSVTAPLWLTVLGYLLLGMILGALVMYWRARRR